MDYLTHVKKSLKILTFDGKVVEEISNTPEATKYGILTLALVGVAYAIGNLNIINVLFMPFFFLIGFFVGYSIYHFLAKFIFGGKATGEQYFRVLSNASVAEWVAAIPILGPIISTFIVSLWLIIVNIYVLEKVHKLSWIKAIIVGLIPLIILGILISGVVLWQLGVTDSRGTGGYVGVTATGFGAIKPLSWTFTASSTANDEFMLINGEGAKIGLNTISFSGSDCNFDFTPNMLVRAGYVYSDSDAWCSGTVGKPYKITVTINYNKTVGGITQQKTSMGTITGKFE